MFNRLYNIYNKMIKYRKLTPKQMRNDDIYLVSYPRSGNTWISFLIINVIILYLDLNIEVNFFNIHTFIPDIHLSREIPERLQFPPFRRIIKSHSSYNPFYKNIFLLVRDPRDVMVSYYHYRKNLGEYQNDISSFIRENIFGINAWVNHTISWLEKTKPSDSINIFYYENFKKKPLKELKRLFFLMGFDISKDILNSAIESSDFDYMKKLEAETASHSLRKYKKFNFIRKGRIGRGKEELNKDDILFIEKKAYKIMKKLNYLN